MRVAIFRLELPVYFFDLPPRFVDILVVCLDLPCIAFRIVRQFHRAKRVFERGIELPLRPRFFHRSPFFVHSYHSFAWMPSMMLPLAIIAHKPMPRNCFPFCISNEYTLFVPIGYCRGFRPPKYISDAIMSPCKPRPARISSLSISRQQSVRVRPRVLWSHTS